MVLTAFSIFTILILKKGLPCNKLAPHCNINTKIADTIGTPIACGKPRTRLLNIVVAIESANTTDKTCKKKKLPIGFPYSAVWGLDILLDNLNIGIECIQIFEKIILPSFFIILS